MLLLEALSIVINLAKEKNLEHEGVPSYRNLEAIELIETFILNHTNSNQ